MEAALEDFEVAADCGCRAGGGVIGVGRLGGEKSIGEVYIPMFPGVNGVVETEDSNAVDREFELEGVDDAVKDRFNAVHSRGHVAVGGGSDSNFDDDKAAGDVVAFPDTSFGDVELA